MFKYRKNRKIFYSCLCIISVCLVSGGWLYHRESAAQAGVALSTPIMVTSLDDADSETPHGGILTQILVSNHSSSPVRVVGFSARCSCIERLFDLPRVLAPGDEVALEVKIYLPLPEGGAPAIVFVEEGQTVWKRKVYFIQ